jgi:hypothetical protein
VKGHKLIPAAQIIFNRQTRSLTPEFFNELNWQEFNFRVKYHAAIMVYKSFNNLATVVRVKILVSLTMNYIIRILHRLPVQTGISSSRVTVYGGNEALPSFRRKQSPES